MLRALVALVVVCPAIARAEAPPPPEGWRLMLSDLTILRVNPLGLETRVRFGLQKKLYRSTKKITENNFVFVGVFPKLNPASAQMSVGGEIQPASIFSLRVFGEVQKFFGTLGFLQAFPSANSNYSDHALAFNKDNPTPLTEPTSSLLKHVSVQPMIQLKVGKIAARMLGMIDYWSYDVRPGGVTVYEPTLDTLLPQDGWTLATDVDLLYVTGTGLAAGLRHSFVRPFYNRRHFVDAADEAAYDSDNAHQRLGFFGAYTFRDSGPSTFNKPTAILIVSWYLQHHYRAGTPSLIPVGGTSEDYRSRAFPYVLAGFAFESDFLRGL